MTPMQGELALYYGFPKPAAQAMEKALTSLGIVFREVLPEELGRRLGELAGLQSPEGESLAAEPFPEAALIFSGLTPQRLKETLALLRQSGAGNACLKAVLTPTNQSWRFCDLLAELRKEREAFARMARPNAES